MNPLLKIAGFAGAGFAWPVVFGYAGTVSVFWIAIGTSLSGMAYFLLRAKQGEVEVGPLSWWPAVVILFCGVQNAFGIENYAKLFANPIYLAIALVLTQIIIVLGTWFLHNCLGFGYMANACLTSNKLIGLTLGAAGVFFMNR